jgi:titin
MVAVVAFSVVATLIGAVIVQTVIQSDPLLTSTAVEIYAHRAAQAGQNAYLTAINANPSLAQCNTNTNGTRMCSGITYGQWNVLNGSDAPGSDQEYYAFGNPQMTFDPITHELTNLSVEVVGAAADPLTANHYRFDQETINVAPTNGFLKNLWWSNYESYNANGNYSTCNYNWNLGYNILNRNVSCGPVYFGPNDYLFGPVYTNDSVFVSGDGTPSNSPSFGTSTSPSEVTTADPNCQFTDSTHGMNGSSSNCAAANSDVAAYDTADSADGHTVEQPPANDTQLGIVAAEYGCLYSGPTQVTLSTDANGNGQMTVVSPDTSEGTQTVNGVQYAWDTNNIPSNVNKCPNNGTAQLPDNGVVFVQNATSAQTQAWANPFDDATYNSATNLTSVPAAPLQANKVQAVTLTATVSSASSHPDAGATVAFSQTTKSFFQTTTSVINSCSAQPLSAPVPVSPPTTPPTYKSTATCATTESSSSTGAFSAIYSGGSNTTSSSANLGQTNTLHSATSYGPDAQVTAGGCTNCYFGQTGSPDAEGDAFVNGSLSGQLTIGTANDVIIDGNITYADCAATWTLGQSGLSAPSKGLCPFSPSGTNDTLGLIANNYAELNRPVVAASSQGPGGPTIEPSCGATPVATCDPSNGSGVTIDAAVLALTQAFVVNNYNDGGTEGDLTVYGSIQQFARGPVGTFSGSSITTGYRKAYTWDPLLDFISPPSYLVPSTASWVLSSVDTNAGVVSNDTCPPLLGPYAGIVNGVSQSGPAITQYCSAPPSAGGLPNFPPITAPSPPTNVTATSNSDGSVTVSWTDPADHASAITHYGVAPSPACSGCSYSNLVGANVTSTRITGLTRGTWYNFSVTATNGVGTSSPSTASNSVIAPDVPSAPTNGSASTNSDGSVTVHWTDPAANGSAITGYGIIPNPSCAGCSYSSLTGPTLTSGTVSGLTRGASYTFMVTATNGVGTGNASAPTNSVTAPNLPGVPTGVSATSGNGTTSVSWVAPSTTGGSAITGYVVTPYIGASPQTPQTFVSTATTETVTGLTNGTAYTFTVAAINGVGTGSQSSASNSVTPATTPGAPTGVTATRGNASASVSWTAPASNGGAAITGYVVTPFIGGAAQTSQTFNSTATTEVATGLTNGTAYTFKVAAINGVGTGAQSSASSAVTPATTPGAPGTPSGFLLSLGSVRLSWSAPGSNGGTAVTGYVVTPYIGGVAQTPQTFNSTATTETVTGLSLGTYTFKVAAINAVGTGPQSTASGLIVNL